MKTSKVMSIVGIIISSFGILGSLVLLAEQDFQGVWALMVYGFFLAFSIVVLKNLK